MGGGDSIREEKPHPTKTQRVREKETKLNLINL